MKYVVRGEDWQEAPLLGTTVTVHETDKAPSPTGLYNHLGDQIYRQPEAIKMGFDTSMKRPIPNKRNKPPRSK